MTSGFHDGERAVQREAGVTLQARRLEGMLAAADLSGGASVFLSRQSFAALTAHDRDGVLWTSPLIAPAGFLQGHADMLRIAAAPRTGDPLHALAAGQQVGLIAIDFAARRRLRINGTLVAAEADLLELAVDQAYGNCPQYIHRQAAAAAQVSTSVVERGASIPADGRHLIAAADTFFLGTTHPTRGKDASHRGGPPGFVRVVSPSRLWWPDFPGNNMFNSFGNLAVDDAASLLFVDGASGGVVHLSGTAHVRFTSPGAPGDDGGVGRRVEFATRQVVSRSSAAQVD
jgi:predicted pyridoxine 5'-phosphate oxidase superfamily flavin-nucleotide-binding protein